MVSALGHGGREPGWWLVDYPGDVGSGQALGCGAGMHPVTVDEVRIAGAAQARGLAQARKELTRRLADVRVRVDEAARGLVVEGVSVRDVADLLGISPGRVSQVVRHSPRSA